MIPALACSRLSVVGSEKRESERKNKGGLRRGTPLLALVLPRFFFSLLFARPQLPRAWNRLYLLWLPRPPIPHTPFSSLETALLLASTKNHDLWAGPTPVSPRSKDLSSLGTCSGPDWLRMLRKLDLYRGRDSWRWPKERGLWERECTHPRPSNCPLQESRGTVRGKDQKTSEAHLPGNFSRNNWKTTWQQL